HERVEGREVGVDAVAADPDEASLPGRASGGRSAVLIGGPRRDQLRTAPGGLVYVPQVVRVTGDQAVRGIEEGAAIVGGIVAMKAALEVAGQFFAFSRAGHTPDDFA